MERIQIVHFVIAIYTIVEAIKIVSKLVRARVLPNGQDSVVAGQIPLQQRIAARLKLTPTVVGVLCALGSALLWSAGYVSLRYVTALTGLFELNLVLVGSGFFFLLAAWILALKNKPEQAKSNRQVARTNIDRRAAIFCMIVVANVASFLFFTGALHYISASQTITLQKLNPLIVVLTTWMWLKHKPSGSAMSATMLAVFGTTVILTSGNETITLDTVERLQGSLFAFLAGVAFAIFGVGLERVRVSTSCLADRLGYMTMVFLLSYILMSTLTVFQRSANGMDSLSLGILVANGLRIAVVYALYQAAIHRIGALLASVIVALEVPMTMIWEWLFLNVVPGWRLCLGSAAIIAAALSLITDQKLKQRREMLRHP